MILALTSYKGGVGKTTLSENIAVSLAHAGKTVCILDADDTGNSAAWGRIRAEDDDLPEVKVIQETNKDDIPFKIKELSEQYDFVIIDSPPSTDPISDGIIIMSNMVIAPITPKGQQEINTVNQFIRKVRALEVTKGKSVPLYFAINLHDRGKPKQKGVIEMMRENFGERVIPTVIRNLAGYEDATFEGRGVVEYSSREAKSEMITFVNDIIRIIKTL